MSGIDSKITKHSLLAAHLGKYQVTSLPVTNCGN